MRHESTNSDLWNMGPGSRRALRGLAGMTIGATRCFN